MAWEATTLDLIGSVGIQTPIHQLTRIGERSVLLLRRFDRGAQGQRLGYVSALTALGASDGDHLDYADIGEDQFRWLFAEDRAQFYLAKEALPERDGFTYVSINFMRAARPRYLAFAGIAGLSLHNWYSNHIYCGHCGRPMVHSENERMVHCDHCHTMIYPRICPAVIVAVRHGDKLLVSKYAGREYKNIALLAGFAEVGETIEETVHREVMEEVGIRVKNLQFYKSQPWCFTDTLLFGFFCDLDGDDTLKVDHGELATAGWIDRKDIPEDTEKASLTMEMMTLFKQGVY